LVDVLLRQETIEVDGKEYTITYIPTATSGCWFTIHDAFEVWAAVAIDLDGTVVGWRNPPKDPFKTQVEREIKRVFVIP